MWPSTLTDAGLGAKAAAQLPTALDVAASGGEHRRVRAIPAKVAQGTGTRSLFHRKAALCIPLARTRGFSEVAVTLHPYRAGLGD